jgi:beta-glucanase (GH16 family)
VLCDGRERLVQYGPVPSERELKVVDDFSGTKLDRTRWATCYRWHIGLDGSRNEGNDEEQWYLDEQVALDHGVLRLTADNRSAVGHHPSTRTYKYRSGIVSALWSFRYGSIEIRARFPHGPGLWPALWLIPDDLTWPPEIDIVEIFGNSPTMAHTFHPRDAPTRQTSKPLKDPTGWKNYRLDWDPGLLVWWVDGKEVFRVTEAVPNVPMYLVMNLAVGGVMGGSTVGTRFPAHMEVASVSLWTESD